MKKILIFFLLCFCLTGCSSRDMALKNALNAMEKWQSYEVETEIKPSIYDIKNEPFTKDFFNAVNKTKITLDTKVQKDETGLKALTQTDVNLLIYNPEKKNLQDNWQFTIYTSSDYSNINDVKLKACVRFLNVPEKFYNQTAMLDARATYFELDLTKIPGVIDYIQKSIANKVPELPSILKTFSWVNVNDAAYRLQLKNSDFNVFISKLLENTNFDYDRSKMKIFFDSISFGETKMTYVLKDNNISYNETSLKTTFDYYNFMNKFMGIPTGINLDIPISINMTQKYSNINNISGLFYPDNIIRPFEEIRVNEFFPSMQKIPDVPKQGRIEVIKEVNNYEEEITFQPALMPEENMGRIYLPLRYMLEEEGYGVKQLADGTLATEKLTDNTSTYDAVETTKQNFALNDQMYLKDGVMYASTDYICEIFGWSVKVTNGKIIFVLPQQ